MEDLVISKFTQDMQRKYAIRCCVWNEHIGRVKLENNDARDVWNLLVT
jgi:hypothetical protein